MSDETEVKPASGEIESVASEPAPAPAAAPADVGEAVGAVDASGGVPRHLETVMQIPVSVKVVLGAATMPVAKVLKLGRGAVVPLDRKVGEPVDVVVNGRVVARGEVVVLDEDTSRFGVSLTEVLGAGGPVRQTGS